MGFKDVITASRPGPRGGGGGEVDDLTTLQRILAEFAKEDHEFPQIVRDCQSLPDRTDFGDRMGATLAHFAEVCAAFARVCTSATAKAPEVARLAQHVKGA